MEPDKFKELETKIDKIYLSVEKTRKYFFWTLMITLACVIIPLIGLAFVLPSFMGNYVDSVQNLGL